VKSLSDYELLRAIYRHLDLAGLCARYPSLTKERVDALFQRLAATLRRPSPEVKKPALQGGSTKPRATTGVKWVTIHTDGAAKGNPGPAGIGFVILEGDGAPIAEASRPLGHTTNNEAEYQAVIAALREALRLGLRRVELRSDSELLIRQLKGEYRVRNPRLAVLHAEVMALVAKLQEFRCRAIPREENARADALASAAALASR